MTAVVSHEASVGTVSQSPLSKKLAQYLPVLPAALWIGLFVAAPLALMFVYSFSTYRNFEVVPELTFNNYIAVASKPAYGAVLLRSVIFAGLITVGALCLAYPFAHFVAFKVRRWSTLLLLLVMVPYWTSSLIRAYAWMTILGDQGVVNQAALWLGLTNQPLQLLYTPFAVIIAGIYVYLPYAILTLYASLEKISPVLREAAADLGATPAQILQRVTLPLSLAGIQAAIIFVFIPAVGLVLIPAVLGGMKGIMFANLLVPIFKDAFNFAEGSALAFVLLALTLIILVIVARSLDLERLYAGGVGSAVARRSEDQVARIGQRAYTGAIYTILYFPIALLILFSFDKSISATFPLRGGTLQWYRELSQDSFLVRSVWNSMYIGVVAAITAVAIAAPAAFAVSRFRFRGRDLLRHTIVVPMVLPSIMLAAGLLTVFATLGVRLSVLTIIIGHVTYVLPYVFLVILAQQHGFDRSVEEAARDLGASPAQVFIRVTLPLMAPGLLVGALFAFTLSLDDFNFALLLTGTSTTLPMYIFSMLRGVTSPTMNALGTILVVIPLCVIAATAVRKGIRARQSKISPEH